MMATKGTKVTKMGQKGFADVNELSDFVRQTAYDVHVDFTPGYLEKVYENLLVHRLRKAGVQVEQQCPIVISDVDGFVVGEYAADLVVERRLIVELKAAATLVPAHEAQLLNYLKATGIRDGLLINFGSEKFQIRKFRK